MRWTLVMLAACLTWAAGCGDDKAGGDSDASAAAHDVPSGTPDTARPGDTPADVAAPDPDAAAPDLPGVADGLEDVWPDAAPELPPPADTLPDAPSTCWTPRPADAARAVIYGLPFAGAGEKPKTWAAGRLAADGALTVDLQAFELGRAVVGSVVFTPNGRFGFVAQGDGTLGIVEIGADLAVTVRDAAYSGEWYAAAVFAGPTEGRLYVVDGNWPAAGGGLYVIDVACDGTLIEQGRVLEGKNAGGMAWLPDGRLLYMSRDEGGRHAHLVDAATWTLSGSVDAFGDDNASLGAAAALDGRYALASDTAAFSDFGGRLALLDVAGPTPIVMEVMAGVPDAFEIAPSPFGGRALVLSGFQGDAIHVVTATPTMSQALRIERSLSSPLPSGVAIVGRGALVGLTVVAQNDGLRLLQLGHAGELQDLGVTPLGGTPSRIPGAIGIQP